MAIYHLNVKIIQRSKGQNAVASAAYRRAAKLFDEKEQHHWDYTNKAGVVHREILIPQDSPLWVQKILETHDSDPNTVAETLWNLVEASEKRVDSQLSREVEFALPLELTQEQNIQLAREFIQDQFVLRGMIADWSVHWDAGNPHVHVMLTMRTLAEEGFGKRVLDWNKKDLLQVWRLKWAEYANFHLRRYLHDVRIDHRSYLDQGIQLVPTIHHGKAVCDMERRGIHTDTIKEVNEINFENLTRVAENPKILFDSITSLSGLFTGQQLSKALYRYVEPKDGFVLTPESIAQIFKSIEQHESVFTEKSLAKTISPLTSHADQFAKAMKQIKGSQDLIYLGAGEDGRDRYTTRKMFHLENTIQKLADEMLNRTHIKIPARAIRQELENYQSKLGKHLTDEQMTAVKHILNPQRLGCLVGRAGTGKSFSLGAAKTVWESGGLRVQGVALSGIAADGLNKDANIPSRTIESFRYAYAGGKCVLDQHDVIVMDEAGMTDSVAMMEVLKLVHEARAKLILVGDHAQLQPIGPGASFRAILERSGFAEIQTIYRQKESWQREATVEFSLGKVTEGIQLYKERDCIHLEKTNQEAQARLVSDWCEARDKSPQDLSQYLVVAHRNEDVKELNHLLRFERIRRGEIAAGHSIQAKLYSMKIAAQDRILFLKNDRVLGVSNGRFATVKQVDFTESGKVLRFTAILDGNQQEIAIDPNGYSDFAYGYAATIHKTQGITVDHSFIYAGGSFWNRHLTYVALSRHRETCRLYAGKETHRDMGILQRNLGRRALKDSLLDYPASFAERRGIEGSSQIRFSRHLSQRLKAWKDRIIDQFDEILDPSGLAAQRHQVYQDKIAIDKTQQRREDARLVATYVDLNRDVGMSWQILKAKLAILGFDKIQYEKQAFELIQGTKEYLSYQSSLQARNKVAYQLVSELERYEQAIGIYEINLDKLKSQAQAHICYENVKQYEHFRKMGAVVLRDRLAAKILLDIKSHYPYLKSVELSTRELKIQALVHQRRQQLITLTADEKSAFKMVEEYQSACTQAGVWWSTRIGSNNKSKQLIKRIDLERSEQLNQKRDAIAYNIVKERDRFSKALDFYQIGNVLSSSNVIPTHEQLCLAQKRWYKLQQCASRHELRERVEKYNQALFQGDMVHRMQMAHEIVKDTKAHQAAVVGLGANTHEVWRTIHRDAKLYDKHNYYRSLNDADKSRFKVVDAYHDAKASHARAWREVFESKKTASISEKTFQSIITTYVSRYTQERNRHSASILENFNAYQPMLKFFGIHAAELKDSAYKHQCFINVQNYINEKNPLLRSKLSLQLIADPKAHHGPLCNKNIDWRQVYRDARIAQRKALFDNLTTEEKSLYRLAEQYVKTKKQSSQLFMRLKTNSNNRTLSVHGRNQLDQAFAKRDYYAWRLVNTSYAIDTDILNEIQSEYRINARQLLQQHAQHTVRLEVLDQFQLTYVSMIKHIGEIQSALDKSKEQSSVILQKALSSIERINNQQKAHRLGGSSSFDYALLTYGLPKTDLVQKVNAIQSLKEDLLKLSNFYNLDTKQIVARTKSEQAHILETPLIQYQKIDIKDLRDQLNSCPERVALHYLGEPKIRSGNTWRYGSNKGSLVVNVRGAKQGLWRDFQTDEGGDMLKLIGHAIGSTNFKEILQEACGFCGGYSTYQQPTFASTQTKQRAQSDLDAYTLSKLQKAQAIHQGTQPIHGTLAEKYLRDHRGVQCALDDNTFRYHPNLKNWMMGEIYPALVVVARDEKEQVCGIQAIFLDASTGRKALIGHHAKLSRGLVGEGALVQKGISTGRVALAEGPETALSVASAHPDWTVYVTFGISNMEKVSLKTKEKSIMICADNDGRDSATAKSIEKTANALARKGIDVWLALPQKNTTQKKWDFNDALKVYGRAFVKEELDDAVLYKSGITQENIIHHINETVSNILPTIQELQITDNNQSISLPKIQDTSLESLLKCYVDMELEQTRWVSEMHISRLKDPETSKELSQKALAHSKNIANFASAAIRHPNVKAELDNLKNIKTIPLAQRGGFIAIRERIAKNEWLAQDIQAVIMQLRRRTQDQTRSRSLKRHQ